MAATFKPNHQEELDRRKVSSFYVENIPVKKEVYDFLSLYLVIIHCVRIIRSIK